MEDEHAPPPYSPLICVTMSRNQAEHLMAALNCIGGPPQGPRGALLKLAHSLMDNGIYGKEEEVDLTLLDVGNGSIYCTTKEEAAAVLLAKNSSPTRASLPPHPLPPP